MRVKKTRSDQRNVYRYPVDVPDGKGGYRTTYNVIKPGDDEEHFQITEPVMACSTFYSWIFNYGGKIKIVVPEKVKQEFDELLHNFD